MKVIHVIGSVASTGGGPSRSVPLQMASLLRAGVRCDLVTQRESASATAEAAIIQRRGAKIFRVGQVSFSAMFQSRSGETERLSRLLKGYDLVHVQGIWTPLCHVAASAARRAKRPVVIAPRGMLEPWALGHRWLKKRTAWHLYQRRDLANADLLQATAPAEAEQFRRLGLRVPVAVIPNGIAVPRGSPVRKRSRGRQLLFLSRIHPKKGLENLLNAIHENKALLKKHGWNLVVAGYDEGGYLKRVMDMASRLGLKTSVTFRGPVEGRAKWELYRASDLFVLPSFSENFGMVVAEALACGLPVITTRGTPWSDLQKHRCGWWVSVGVAPLSAALKQAAVLSRPALARMGRRGRILVRQRFSWDILGRTLREVYSWVLRGGPPPSCIELTR